MIEKFTIMKTRRYGDMGTEVGPIAVLMRSKNSPDQAIRFANDMINRERPITNEEFVIEVLYSKENGVTETIHTVEKYGEKSK